MVMKKFNPKYTFQQFNAEVNELYDNLKSENYKEEEIKQFFSPLTTKIGHSNSAQCIVLSLVALVTFIYFLTYIDSIYWHFSAIGRIILIKILPYFDWRYLKNKHCLIEKFDKSSDDGGIVFNCDLCEHIHKIDVYEDIDEEILSQRYIELDVPIIVTKGLEHWPRNASFIEDLILDDIFYYSYPCKVSTNINKGVSNAGRVLEKVRLFEEFFLQFQNCESDAMKTFRKFTYRPAFLPATYSPILYNWLMWNRNYNTTNYKFVELVERLAVLGQILGSTYVRLIPRENCANICPTMDIKVNTGEALIFTSMWDLEYKPKEVGENIAVILEAAN